MGPFWHFAKRMLRYRRLLAIAGAAALADALLAFAGFGALMGMINLIFTDPDNANLRRQLIDRLDHPIVHNALGDPASFLSFVPEDPFRGFAMGLVIILCIATVGSVMRFTHAALAVTVTQRTMMMVRRDAFARLLHVPWDLLQQAGSADHLSRVVSDTSKLGIGLTALMGRAVRDTLMGGVFLTWAVLIDWRLTLLFMVGIIPIGICIRKLGKRVRKASKAALQQYARMVGSLQESMQAADVVRVHNAEGYERRRFSRVNRRVYGEEMKARTARALSSPVVELIAMACVMAVATVAAWYVFRTPGGEPARMLGVLAALGAAGASLRPLANLHNELQAGSAAAGRLMELLALPTERDQVDADHGVMLPRHERAVSFDAVTYHYPDAIEPALDAVTLDVQQGQTIAIVGPNGAGKSTLVSLLPRLIEPASGRVLIDGHDVGEATLRSVRQQMAVVTQRSVLFAGTIAQNIAYGRRHANRDQVEQAAKAAFADDFIARLPGGYDTLLGDGGTGLSGGQKQRLCIARAVLRDPAILILDEATSQIDAESEARIAEALRRLRRGRTTFVIAHRLSTVVDADRIVVMEAGRIVDQGRHDELVQRCDLYRTLAGSQLAPAAA